GPFGSAASGRVEGPGDQVQALQRGLLRGEVPAGAHRPAVPGVERLDGVGTTDDPADLHVVVQERDELRPGGFPEADDGRVLATPRLRELVEAGRRGLLTGCGVHRPQL